jgi:hypothetical protein
MDGNLLDPDNADATLAKEWNLPELPAGVQEKLLFQTLITPVLFYLKCTSLHCTMIVHGEKQVRMGGCGKEVEGHEMNTCTREVDTHNTSFRGVATPINSFPPHAEKSSSMPGSSRELAEIFGTSDDEEDMDFPFSLNVDKTFPDLNLADGRVSEFFLKSINSLGVPVSIDSSMVPSSGMAGGGPESAEAGEGKYRVNVMSGMKGVNTTSTEGVITAPAVSTPDKDGGGEKGSGVEGIKPAVTCDMDTAAVGEEESAHAVATSGNYILP